MLGSNVNITTYRLANTGNTTAWSGTATISGMEAYLESQQQELVAALGERPGIEVYLMHLDPCDIKQGDKVVADTGTYFVVGIEKHEGNQDTEDVYTVRLHREVPRYV